MLFKSYLCIVVGIFFLILAFIYFDSGKTALLDQDKIENYIVSLQIPEGDTTLLTMAIEDIFENGNAVEYLSSSYFILITSILIATFFIVFGLHQVIDKKLTRKFFERPSDLLAARRALVAVLIIFGYFYYRLYYLQPYFIFATTGIILCTELLITTLTQPTQRNTEDPDDQVSLEHLPEK